MRWIAERERGSERALTTWAAELVYFGLITPASRPVPAPADELVGRLFATLDAFASGAPQTDDITVAVIRYRGRTRASRWGTPER